MGVHVDEMKQFRMSDGTNVAKLSLLYKKFDVDWVSTAKDGEKTFKLKKATFCLEFFPSPTATQPNIVISDSTNSQGAEFKIIVKQNSAIKIILTRHEGDKRYDIEFNIKHIDDLDDKIVKVLDCNPKIGEVKNKDAVVDFTAWIKQQKKGEKQQVTASADSQKQKNAKFTRECCGGPSTPPKICPKPPQKCKTIEKAFVQNVKSKNGKNHPEIKIDAKCNPTHPGSNQGKARDFVVTLLSIKLCPKTKNPEMINKENCKKIAEDFSGLQCNKNLDMDGEEVQCESDVTLKSIPANMKVDKKNPRQTHRQAKLRQVDSHHHTQKSSIFQIHIGARTGRSSRD
jgi:hypothetical protein